MTATLQKAFKQAAALPERLQRQLAKQLLEDIAGERKWDETFSKSQGLLEKMAERARQTKRAGKTRRQGFDEL